MHAPASSDSPADSGKGCSVRESPAELLRKAQALQTSPFDYIIVGSGAGGGPLACRLAESGRKVLLLEAGDDPQKASSRQFPDAKPGEITSIPGYHGAATEDHELSWQFSVRHFEDDQRQSRDEKYNRLDANVDDGRNPVTPYPADPRFLDPGSRSARGKGGIFYPRSANVGGCTAHHAMIVVKPNDKDWDYIANLTGDESWRPSKMNGYFTRLEKCLYREQYQTFFRKLLGVLYVGWRWIVKQLNPRAVLDNGGHGDSGWQPTSFIDPALVEEIAKKDMGFFNVLARSALGVILPDRPLLRVLKRAALMFGIVEQLDYNDANTRRNSREGVFLIPTGIKVSPKKRRAFGQRVGVREFIEETREKYPDQLVLETGVHATRVIFADTKKGVPRAIGVEVARGRNLYEASPLQDPKAPRPTEQFFITDLGGEVILCGGAFNTPQLLMLSGIGDRELLQKVATEAPGGAPGQPGKTCVLCDSAGQPLLDGDRTPRRIHLPGVGRNLQDRYEVSVVSEINHDFTTLNGVSFAPGDPKDPALAQWREDQSGLYRTNGGTIAILKRTSAVKSDDPEADTFTFGAPAAFRGYYWGWSRELFRPRIGAANDQHNLWSWIILKAYTKNHAGRVQLRTADPFHTPDICFDSFNEAGKAEFAQLEADIKRRHAANLPCEEQCRRRDVLRATALKDGQHDLDALVETIKSVRAINACNREQFVREIQPGLARPDGSDELKEWIQTQAWGHHCSCTCRIGSDRWRENVSDLQDKDAVLDSHFRVHGVKGLRVVDASVFPRIPGYFILAPLLMVSEKAADTILKDRAEEHYYPEKFQQAEAEAIRRRRERALPTVKRPASARPDRLPADTVGWAMSGGGIRSATFALGVLQALAAKNRLREIDLMSTVSGGGFTGGFLGRLFTRDIVGLAADPAGRAQAILSDTSSGPLWWLRQNANYIFATGSSDFRQNLAIFWRNIFSVHLVVGVLLFASFGLLAWLPDFLGVPALPAIKGVPLSVWWLLPAAVLGLALIPVTLGYWIAPLPGSYRAYSPFSFLAWLVALGGATGALLLPHGTILATAGIGVLVLAWLWEEAARWEDTTPDGKVIANEKIGAVVRNRLTRTLGTIVILFALVTGWAVLDTFALLFARNSWTKATVVLVAALGPFLPVLRWLGMQAQKKISEGIERGAAVAVAKLIGIPLGLVLLFAVDVLAHQLVLVSPGWGWGIRTIALAFVFSGVLGRAFHFLNNSSLHATYAARLTRTFQGASNEARVFGNAHEATHDIKQSHPADDVPFDLYHPEENGGPLHFINVCVNETVDLASQREVRDRKGLPMCLSPHGVSVGRSYFACWTPPDDEPGWQKRRRWFEGFDGADPVSQKKRAKHRHGNSPDEKAGKDSRYEKPGDRKVALQALRSHGLPDEFHVLATQKSESAEVESLTLGGWIAVSGAAFTTGQGRATSTALALFLGLLNVRLGFWWDTGILSYERPGAYPPSLWQRLKRLPLSLFRMHSMVLSEWLGRFDGPSRWFWYLSDGGHFEVTALYELIRRRVPFMILTDGGEDAAYAWDDLTELIRQVRVDFGAQVKSVAPADAAAALPPWIKSWINLGALCPLDEIRRDSKFHAAVACVTYDHDDEDRKCWLLVLKPGISGDMPEDIKNYGKRNEKFPQDPTLDQVFDEPQWESYRKLGESLGHSVILKK